MPSSESIGEVGASSNREDEWAVLGVAEWLYLAATPNAMLLPGNLISRPLPFGRVCK
jgi:hypothetical protein